MPKFKNILRFCQRLRKGEKPLLWIQCKIMETLCFSADACQYNIACSVVHLQLSLKLFKIIVVAFLPIIVVAN